MRVLSGEGVRARKQVPIVQQGVMREVMRVWISRAALQVHRGSARDSQGTERTEEGQWVSMKIAALYLDSG